MRKAAIVISAILGINVLVGYLFQLNKQMVCVPELMVLGMGGLIFWMLIYKPLQLLSHPLKNKGVLSAADVIRLGIAGMLLIGVNLLFCFFFLKASMIALYGCDSSAFKLLNISLTNNITGNIFCYSSLVYLSMRDKRIAPQPKLGYKSAESIGPDIRPELPASKSKMLPDYLFLEDSKNSKIKVYFATISHIAVQKNCTIIHAAGRKFVKYQSLKSFKETLPPDQFLQIHRSTIINLAFIEELTNLPSGMGKQSSRMAWCFGVAATIRRP